MRAVIAMRQQDAARTRRTLRRISYLCLSAGILALGYAGYAVLDRAWYQEVETSRFEIINAAPKPPTIQTDPVAIGGVIGEIEVPRLNLKAIVVQGDSDKLLRRAVGHLPETALPGEIGNVALAGHRDGIFRPLRNVRPGDLITLRTPQREFQYEVQWTAVVPPTAVRVLEPTTEPVLTLVTCFPFYYLGAAPERFVIRAHKLLPAPVSANAP